MIHPLAGTRPDPATLVTREELEERYRHPRGELAPVQNGTSGHRGSTGAGFSEQHVAAMTQALCDIRRQRGTFGPSPSDDPNVNLAGHPLGPIVLGKDVRFTSDFAVVTAAEVFAGNGMRVVVHRGDRATPTPVVSHTILRANARGENMEGAIVTASHNPPDDAGYKSNGLDGGPNTRTRPVDELANLHLAAASGIRRLAWAKARDSGLIVEEDLVTPYARDLGEVVDMDRVRGGRFAATPLGGSAWGYYAAVNHLHGTSIQLALDEPDPASAHRTYDWDGRLRGDPSSPWVMQAVAGLRHSLGVDFIGANDNDADRFGGEDATGVLNPNHVLCVLFDYLARVRGFAPSLGIGRTIGTTHMLDRIAQAHGRPIHEVNVGFKWYVKGLLEGKYVLAGEESAGLSLPRRNGRPWVTEKDGIAAVLLLFEVMGHEGKDIGTLYRQLESRYGVYSYERVDTPATTAKKSRLLALAQDAAEVTRLLSGKRIAGRSLARLTVGDGIKLVLEDDVWVLKRPSGTENIIKDYREERGETLETARRASREMDHLLGLDPV